MKHTINVYITWREEDKECLERLMNRYAEEGFEIVKNLSHVYGEGYEKELKEGYVGVMVLHRQQELKP